MPSTGMPRSSTAGSQCGAPGSKTLLGPPEKMIPLGRISATRAAGRSCRTTWQQTFSSRTRRAMSCAYWAPKSKTRTSSSVEEGFMVLPGLVRGHLGGVGRMESEQLFEHSLVVHAPVTAESLNFDMDLVSIVHKLD